jgi:hypothetical protein
LAVNAIVAGILLGGFYAAVTVGVTISFGMLDIVNIAHPAFIMLGSFVAYSINSSFGFDPILIGIVIAPVFFLLGTGVYRIYYYAFERRGEESIRGLAFFFGLLFVGEVALILIFGVDYRFVEAPYIGSSLHLGPVDLPLRTLIPCRVSLLMIAVVQFFLVRTFIGRAILAVSQVGAPVAAPYKAVSQWSFSGKLTLIAEDGQRSSSSRRRPGSIARWALAFAGVTRWMTPLLTFARRRGGCVDAAFNQNITWVSGKSAK